MPIQDSVLTDSQTETQHFYNLINTEQLQMYVW